MGRAVAARADLAIITTDNPRREDPEDIATGCLSGVRDGSTVEFIPDRTKAIERALSLAGPGDCGAAGRQGARGIPGHRRAVRSLRRPRGSAALAVQLRAATGVSWLDGAWMAVGNS